MNSYTDAKLNKLSRFERCNICLKDAKKLHLMLSVLLDKEGDTDKNSITKLMQSLDDVMVCIRLSAEEGKEEYIKEQSMRVLETLEPKNQKFLSYVKVFQDISGSVNNPENQTSVYYLPNSHCIIDKSKLKKKYEKMEPLYLSMIAGKKALTLKQSVRTYNANYLLHTTMVAKKMQKKNEQRVKELIQNIDMFVDIVSNALLMDMGETKEN